MSAKSPKVIGKKYRARGMTGTLKAILSGKTVLGVGEVDNQSFLGPLGELQLTPFITHTFPLDELEEVEENSADEYPTYKN